MNRRSFFRSLAKGVLATAAMVYAPRLLETREPARPLPSIYFRGIHEGIPPTRSGARSSTS